MKKSVFIFLSVCTAAAVAGVAMHAWRDTNAREVGARRVEARFTSDEEWRPCTDELHCGKPSATPTPAPLRCTDSGGTAREVITFLIEQPKCAAEALSVIDRASHEDLAAAHLYLAASTGDASHFLAALRAIEASQSTDVTRFNRALIYEKLQLNDEAIRAWRDYLQHDDTTPWATEARQHLTRLHPVNPSAEFEPRRNEFLAAVARADRPFLTALVEKFPSGSRGLLEKYLVLPDASPNLLLVAQLIDERAGDSYARDLVQPAFAPASPDAWIAGRDAFADARKADGDIELWQKAIDKLKGPHPLLARVAEVRLLGCQNSDPELAQSVLDRAERLAPMVERYPHLAATLDLNRALALSTVDRHLDGIKTTERAMKVASALNDNQLMVSALVRKSGLSLRLGKPKEAFDLALAALKLLPYVANPREQNNLLGTVAGAARGLGFLPVARTYQQHAVDLLDGVAAMGPGLSNYVAKDRAVAVRELADIEFEMGERTEAQKHLAKARALLDNPDISAIDRPSLEMRLRDVEGRAALQNHDYSGAINAFTQELMLAADETATYRANALLKRAAAHRFAGNDDAAQRDVDDALTLVRGEEQELLARRTRGDNEAVWSAYFERFGDDYRQREQELIAAGDLNRAFAVNEQSRGFEPLFLLMQSAEVPPPFRSIAAVTDPERLRRFLPPATVIIQYVVLEDRSYAFILSRDLPVKAVPLGVSRAMIGDWVDVLQRAATDGDPDKFQSGLSAPYQQLIDPVLNAFAYSRSTSIIFVPDGPMHGLPFNALYDASKKEYLVQKAPIGIAGSTRLFVYAVLRDSAIPLDPLKVSLFGNPKTDAAVLEELGLGPLGAADAEVTELKRLYGDDAELIPGQNATSETFLARAAESSIIHFAGHARANVQEPFNSYLLLAGRDVLSANDLLTRLIRLQRTRLVVLGACSSAGGLSRGLAIGPEGMAPLVRPFIAANVPAVLGTLWEINDDDTTRQLLVSFHRHYKTGLNVTESLRNAQLEMILDKSAGKNAALAWGGFQVIGYATSPFPSRTDEGKKNDDIHSQNSLHRPDGLHSQ
jgi:CHAT domain-containing protein